MREYADLTVRNPYPRPTTFDEMAQAAKWQAANEPVDFLDSTIFTSRAMDDMCRIINHLRTTVAHLDSLRAHDQSPAEDEIVRFEPAKRAIDSRAHLANCHVCNDYRIDVKPADSDSDVTCDQPGCTVDVLHAHVEPYDGTLLGQQPANQTDKFEGAKQSSSADVSQSADQDTTPMPADPDTITITISRATAESVVHDLPEASADFAFGRVALACRAALEGER